MSTTKSGVATGYLHGFSRNEQDRLYEQARFLEASVYQKVDFSAAKKLIEVGCGVGAQTEILLERFPNLHVTGIDFSADQISRAKNHLSDREYQKRVDLHQGDALHLTFKDDSFDGAFLCWFLEHVQEPVAILNEIRRVMKPHATIVCNEVLNATFYVHPYSPATLKYWFEFNDHQWNMKGDPFVGGKLANYLLKAGFQNIETQVITHHYDNRTPKKRAQFIEFWTSLLMSGADSLIKADKVTVELVNEMQAELTRLKNEPDAVIFYSWVQAQAKAL
jgi:ubiquinone/menaquinone biosynthesis C-methylase UbiE